MSVILCLSLPERGHHDHLQCCPSQSDVQTRRCRYGYAGYGYGYVTDTDDVICIRTRHIRIHVPGGFYVPVSNTSSDIIKSSSQCSYLLWNILNQGAFLFFTLTFFHLNFFL